MANNQVNTEKIYEITNEINSIVQNITDDIENINNSCNSLIQNCTDFNSYHGQEVMGSRVEKAINKELNGEQVYSHTEITWKEWSISGGNDIISYSQKIQKELENIKQNVDNVLNLVISTQISADNMEAYIANLNPLLASLTAEQLATFFNGFKNYVATDEYSAANGNYVGVKSENEQWWLDGPLYAQYDKKTGSVVIYQMDGNEKAYMGWIPGDKLVESASNVFGTPTNTDNKDILPLNQDMIDKLKEAGGVIGTTLLNTGSLLWKNLTNNRLQPNNTNNINNNNAEGIEILNNSRVEEARQKYSSLNSIKTYNSNNTSSIVYEDVIGNDKVTVTRITVNNPSSQIKIEQANGSYKNGAETATDAYNRLTNEGKKPVAVINASNFNNNPESEWYGTQDLESNKSSNMNKLTIANNQLVDRQSGNGDISNPSSVKAGGAEVALSKDGTFFRPKPGTSGQELLDEGVQGTVAIHETPLVIPNENGVGQVSPTVDDPSQSSHYDRNVLGQTPDGEIYIVTGCTDKRAVSEYMVNLGCNFATSMDQGGSVSMVFDGEDLYRDPDNERPVGDFIAIYDE